MPPISASGTLRPGFFTSPAAMGMLFQPSYAHSAASIARPNAVPPPPLTVPVAATCDQSAVFETKNTPSTTVAMPPSLSTVSSDCTRPPKVDGEAVDHGEEHDGGHRYDLLRAELPVDGLTEQLDTSVRPDGRHREDRREERRKADPEDRDRAGGADHKAHPAVEEGGELAVGVAQIDVLPARLREHRAKLGVGERAGQRQHSRRHPRHQHHRRRTGVLRHDGGLDEHSRADHGADHERGRIGEGETASEMVVRGGDMPRRAGRASACYGGAKDPHAVVSTKVAAARLFSARVHPF